MLSILALLALLLAAVAPAAAVQPDELPPDAGRLPELAVVVLADPPTASYEGGLAGLAATRPAAGARLDVRHAAVVAYRRHLTAQRARLRGWLATNAAAAEVVGELDLVANAVLVRLNGEALARLRGAPGVADVQPERLYRATMNASLPLIGAPALWERLQGVGSPGAGLKVGVIDTGVDQSHPFLTDPGLTPPPGFPKGDSRYTSGKVIVARAYPYPPSPTTTPADLEGHGTHVAGTVAGVPTTIPGFGGPVAGVAPAAWIGNYKGLAGEGGTGPSFMIARAVEDAVADGMDVLNLSLGSAATGTPDVLERAVNAAVDAGVVVVVAAGNDGPGAGSVSSPGVAAKAITVGASANPHFLASTVFVEDLGTLRGAIGDFGPLGAADSGPLFDWRTLGGDGLACEPAGGPVPTGAVAVVQRGSCSFTTKIRNAQAAGAVAVLVVNNQAGDPAAMAHDGTPNPPSVPALMIAQADGARLLPAHAGHTATGSDDPPAEATTGSADILAQFSGQGPTVGTSLIKPDVTSPGVNVLSSVPPGGGWDWALFNGTSMAAPHVAGAAALLLQLHPDWTPAQVKSALVGTARRPVTDYQTGLSPVGVLARGGGRIDLARAGSPVATTEPSSLSLGLRSAASRWTVYKPISVANTSGAAATYRLGATGSDGTLRVTLWPSTLTLNPGAVGRIWAIVTARPSAAGDREGDITLTLGSSTTPDLRIPWWVRRQ